MSDKPFHIRTTAAQLRRVGDWVRVYAPDTEVDLIVDDRMLVARTHDGAGAEHVGAWDTDGSGATRVYHEARLWETEPWA